MGSHLMEDPTPVPADLPRPAPDGAADHLPGMTLPPVSLASTSGGRIRVDVVPEGFERLVIYAYPLTGVPGVEPPIAWEDIPGALGCTPESCGFRDHAAELRSAGAAVVGLSTQSTAYQLEAAERLRLPFPLLSDTELELTLALRLPTFTAHLRPEHDGGGTRTLLKRLTLVVRGGRIEKVFYPVFPPGAHAEEVLAWLPATARP
jgi:peroxiredoxin